GDITTLRGAVHDVTEHRNRRRDLEQIETLFRHTQDSLFLIDVAEEFTVERVNPAYEETTGMSAEQLQGRTPKEILGEREGATVERRYRDCVERREPLAYTEQLRFDGNPMQWETRIAPVVLDGSVEHIAGATRDVTDRENRKSELQEYETIIETLSDAVYVLNEDGRFRYVNDEFVELVGYDRETILGNTPSLIKEEGAVERAERELGRLLSSDGPEAVTFEVTVQPREGDPIVCEDHMGVLPYEGDRFSGSVGTLRDITGRKARERELKAVKSQYQTLIESYPDGAIFLYDTDLRVVRAGGSELSEVGLTLDEIEGTTPRDRHPPEIAEELVGNIENALGGESHTLEQEYQGEHYRVQIVPVRINKEEITHAMAVSRNITDRIENRRELERQNERLDEFTSLVSHDLRSPLTVAEGHLRLAQRTRESERLAKAADAIARGQALIDDLLTLARKGERATDIASVALADVAEDCWQATETKSAALDVNATRGIRADGRQLRELFENLYRNAVEHGGDDVTVSVGVMDGGFYVADTGPGVPESDREEIFEAGYSTNEDGIGFGLRIVDRIAGAHGWNITAVESEQGGARFEITGVEFGDG
ncbi:MAG: PAS domain S-box protein, partial [Haloplanus sp.]